MMQEIPLEHVVKKRDKHVSENQPEPVLSESDIDRRESYKKMVLSAFSKFQKIEKHTKWHLYQNSNTDTMLYSDETDRILKVEGFVPIPGYNFFRMCTDHNYATKSQWARQDSIRLLDCYLRETFDLSSVQNKLRIVQSRWKIAGLITKPRDLLGVEFTKYNNEKQTYTVIFQACHHNIFKHDQEAVPFMGSYSIWVDCTGPNQCFVSLIVDLSRVVEGFISPLIMDRLKQYLVEWPESFASIPFDEIYSEWECQMCQKQNDSHLLECRYCTIARYWKCLDNGCKQSQPKHAENNCVYCGKEKE